jgi:glutaredoxin
MSALPAVAELRRPEISVYWKRGCSSCLKLKEFVEEQGLPFESVNIDDAPERMEEILAAGLRSIPIVRRGDKFSYAQSMDDVAAFLGVSPNHKRLPNAELLQRWDQVLSRAQVVAQSFSDDMLARDAITLRNRPVRDLCAHVFQIAEAFMVAVDDNLADTRGLISARATISNREQLLAYIDSTRARYSKWTSGRTIPATMQTYYGPQPGSVVLERGVWHSAQHARQLDVIAAGNGAEFQIDPALFTGLPMPKRLWA